MSSVSRFIDQLETDMRNELSANADVRGTVIGSLGGSKVNVKIDGGETCPCSTAVKCIMGDRVIVRNVGGTLTIVSNLTKPATDDTYAENAFGDLVMQLDEIRVDTGRFDNVFANGIDAYVIVSDTISAADLAVAKAKAEQLDAQLISAKDATVEFMQAYEVQADHISADAAVLQQAAVTQLVAESASIGHLKTAKADINFANVTAADIGIAKMQELFARTGLFEDLTVLGDGTLTGVLRATLLDGDTARFSNIYADALKILGEDGLYHALNFMGMSEAMEYTAVTPEAGDNPSENKWYERSGEEGSYVYTPTFDTAVVSGKTYYEGEYTAADTQAMVEKYGESLEGGLHGSHLIAESVTATQIDVSSLIAAMLLAQQVQIGASGGIHIEAVNDRFSFFQGGSGWAFLPEDQLFEIVASPTGDPSVQGWYERSKPDEQRPVDRYVKTADTAVQSGKSYYASKVAHDKPLSGEVAFITTDGDWSTFYMNRSIVVNELRFGDWQWKALKNGAIALTWIGE